MEIKALLQDIDQMLLIIEKSITWATTYETSSFPYSSFKEKRRELKKIKFALEEKCSAAAYGESQNGKSYLISSLLSDEGDTLTISAGKGGSLYSFIDDINPSGGNTSKKESTGIITRFTVRSDNTAASEDKVKVRLLTMADIISLLADSFYKDVKINASNLLQPEDINSRFEKLLTLIVDKNYTQSYIEEDDIYDIQQFLNVSIGSSASNVYSSKFCTLLSTTICHIHPEDWGKVFRLLWNDNEAITSIFQHLVTSYQKLRFQQVVYVPFSAILRQKGTILDITWLDHLFEGQMGDINPNYETVCDVYDKNNTLLTRGLSKAAFSALVAELTLVLPSTALNKRPFLKNFDLLDFPGARHRMKLPESSIQTELSMMLRRGKVSYLFDKYSDSLRINSILFCQNMDKPESELGEVLSNWIDRNIGETPQKRAEYIRNTNYVSPFFIISTFFNCDLQHTKETREFTLTVPLSERWKTRFENHLCNEVIKPSIYTWFDKWVSPGNGFSAEEFQSIYLLRDFFWSSNQHIFRGYRPGESNETEMVIHHEYPEYIDDLKQSFISYPFVQQHFASPEKSWNDAATLNHDGSRAIISSLEKIAVVIDDARQQKYYSELVNIRDYILQLLLRFYVSGEETDKREDLRRIAGEMKFGLDMLSPSCFGKLINSFMVNAHDIRYLASDIVLHKKELPQDFTLVNVLRINAGINPSDPKEANLKKLCEYYHTNEEMLRAGLKMQNIDIEDVVSGQNDTMTTEADILAKNISNYWCTYIDEASCKLSKTLIHAETIAYLYVTLFRKFNIRQIIATKIQEYANNIEDKDVLSNIIADSVSLLLNDFVTSVGHRLMTDEDKTKITSDAYELCIPVEKIDDSTKAQASLKDTMEAFEKSVETLRFQSFDENSRRMLRRLPLWDNFKRWENMLVMALVFTGEISDINEEANREIGSIIEICKKI